MSLHFCLATVRYDFTVTNDGILDCSTQIRSLLTRICTGSVLGNSGVRKKKELDYFVVQAKYFTAMIREHHNKNCSL